MNKPIALTLAIASSLVAQDARQIVAESQKRTRSDSQRYEGTLKVTDASRKVTEKRWIYDRLGSHGNSKTVLRFNAPPEVKGVALLVVNHPDRASDQWMWTPALGRERRIAFQDRSTRFFGTDFTFEDLEERDTDQYTYKMLLEEPLDGALCWKMESRPTKSSQYTHSYVWIRKDNYVPAQIESYKGAKLIRRLRYSDIQNVQGIWTPRRLEMHDLGRDSRTVLTLDKLEYNLPLKEEQFTIQGLRRES